MLLHQLGAEVEHDVEHVEGQPGEEEGDRDADDHDVGPPPPSIVLRVLRLRPVAEAAVDGDVHAEHDHQGHHELDDGRGEVVDGPGGNDILDLELRCHISEAIRLYRGVLCIPWSQGI